MIVSEFIDWLKTQDQDATVQILVRDKGRHYSGYSTCQTDFIAEEHADYTDMRGNMHVKPEASYFNARTLFLGLEE